MMWTYNLCKSLVLQCFQFSMTKVQNEKSMWIWRRTESISWVDKISNKEVLAKVEDDRQMTKVIQQRQHHWIGHTLRHQSLLLDIIKGWIKEDLKDVEWGCRCQICWQKQLLHWFKKLKTDGDEHHIKTCCIAEYWRRRRRKSETFKF